MIRFNRAMAGIAGAVLLMSAGLAAASPILNVTESWTTPGNTDGWQVTGATNSGSVPVGGYIEVQFPPTGFPFPVPAVTIYATNGVQGGAYVGDYYDVGADLSVTFQYRGTDQPDSLSLYFFDTTTQQAWIYNLGSPAASGSFATYQVAVNTVTWTLLSDPSNLGVSYFSTAFSSVDQFGFYIVENGVNAGSPQIYDLTGLVLAVPEPETIWLMMAVLLSLVITFRGRLGEMAGQMKRRLIKA